MPHPICLRLPTKPAALGGYRAPAVNAPSLPISRDAHPYEILRSCWTSDASEAEIKFEYYQLHGSLLAGSLVADEVQIEPIPNFSVSGIAGTFAVNVLFLVDTFKTKPLDKGYWLVLADPPAEQEAVRFGFLDSSVEWRPTAGRFYWNRAGLPASQGVSRQNYQQANQQIIDKIYKTDASGQPRRAMDYVVDMIDDLLNRGEFDECQAILGRIDTDRLSDAVLVSFLGITYGAKRKLEPERRRFYERAFQCVAHSRGVEGARRLLEKYL